MTELDLTSVVRAARQLHRTLSLIWAATLCALPAWGLERPVVVSAYQGPCIEGEFSRNVETARAVIRQARGRDTQFLLFPECFLSGRTREALERGARSLDDGELSAFIRESADHDMVILAGIARRVGTSLLNSVLVIHRGGLLGWHDKVMLGSADRATSRFTAGNELSVFQAHGVRFAVLIGAEGANSMMGLSARLQGASMLFLPGSLDISDPIAGSTAEDHPRRTRLVPAGMATQFGMAVVHASVIDPQRSGSARAGDSFVLNPRGEAVAESRSGGAELTTVKLEPAMFEDLHPFANPREAPRWLRSQLADLLTNFRRPANDADLRNWLRNMIQFHRFTPEEVSDATGLTLREIEAARQRLGLNEESSANAPGAALRVLPYPGGRHPRLGFFEGAIAPQRETKVSVFTPWDDHGYVVVDVPEAIFSNLGLTYLAHTHIPTIWDEQRVKLPPSEWNHREDGTLTMERELPNGIAFGTLVMPAADGVRFELWLRNGTSEALSGLRVQNCVMLGRASGFAAQTLANKVFADPFAAAHSEDGSRWIITAWERCGRAWGNERVPCVHSDPVFPDCLPGETVRLGGWLSFYEGADIHGELARLANLGVPVPPANR